MTVSHLTLIRIEISKAVNGSKALRTAPLNLWYARADMHEGPNSQKLSLVHSYAKTVVDRKTSFQLAWLPLSQRSVLYLKKSVPAFKEVPAATLPKQRSTSASSNSQLFESNHRHSLC